MAVTPTSWRVLAVIALMVAIVLFFFDVFQIKGRMWRLFFPEFLAQNSILQAEVDALKRDIANLRKKNAYLQKGLAVQERHFLRLAEATKACGKVEMVMPQGLPDALTDEGFDIRLIYNLLLTEKRRWDHYQQHQYDGILENTLEPIIVESHNLILANDASMQYFYRLESALRLHRRLIRDVRLFHDEIQFEQKQHRQNRPYQAYDLKLQLSPFARESGIADALQQAMSTLSAGLYQQQAAAVLNRMGDAFTQPIEHLYQQLKDPSQPAPSQAYNYNIYIVFGKKLMQYADMLAQQSLIQLAPSARGELDFFHRRLAETFYNLYEIGKYETLSSTHLDFEALERELQGTD
jgi:hypothetical protein